MEQKIYKPVKLLSGETARKIAAGEVIDRPAAVVRELLDNSIDAGSSKISVEIEDGGIKYIRVSDDGCGMSREDLSICTKTHSTSKIAEVSDLLKVESLGFRGEALSSIQAVSGLEITTVRDGFPAWKLSLGSIEPARLAVGTVIEVKNLFENFPARKKFLKKSSFEATQCRQIFIEKALPHNTIEMRYSVNGSLSMFLPKTELLKKRCLDAFNFEEPEELFFEIHGSGNGFSFSAVLGTPDVVRSNKRHIYIFVNGRRINEYGLIQSVCYGAEGYFPNGVFPAVFVFLKVNPAHVDFNIHPAKKEARFENYQEIHRAIHTAIGSFYRQKTIAVLLKEKNKFEQEEKLAFPQEQMESRPHYEWSEKSTLYYNMLGGGRSNLEFAGCAKDEALYNYCPAGFAAEKVLSVSGFDRVKDDFANMPGNSFETLSAYRAAEAAGLSGEGFSYGQEAEKTGGKTSAQPFKFLGQFCGTFIAVEKNDSLYIIDQHAAHERIIYEKLKNSQGACQELLAPYVIETSSCKTDEALRKNKEKLKAAGFNLIEEGEGIWQITSVPIMWHGTEKQLKEDLSSAKEPENLLNHLLATAACRAACKDGDLIDNASACEIAKKTFELPEPLCPHGRPLYFIIDRAELFKRIKRT